MSWAKFQESIDEAQKSKAKTLQIVHCFGKLSTPQNRAVA